MTQHQPIETLPTLYICPICAWRGVLTTNGIVTTEHGDASADHRAAIIAQQQAARATAERIMARLRDHYASGALSLRRVQRLTRAVIGEFRT